MQNPNNRGIVHSAFCLIWTFDVNRLENTFNENIVDIGAEIEDILVRLCNGSQTDKMWSLLFYRVKKSKPKEN